MALISAKDYKNKGSSGGSVGMGSSSGLVSAAEFKKGKKTASINSPEYNAQTLSDQQQMDSFQQTLGTITDYKKQLDAMQAEDNPELQSRGDLRTDYPGGWLNPVNDLNFLRRTKGGQLVDRFAQGIGHTIGLDDSQMSSSASTGNKYLDKAADIAGGATGYVVNPGMPVGNLSIAQNFFDHPALQQIAQLLGGKAQNLLPDAGMAISKDGTQIVDSLLGKTVNKAVQGGVQGGLGAAAFSPFHTLETGGDVQDIPGHMLEEGLGGAAFGGLIGAAAPSVSKALSALIKRRGGASIADDSLLPFEDAVSNRNVSQARGTVPPTAQQAADRFGFIDQRTATDGPLALPPSNREIRMNAAQSRGTNPAGLDPIQGQGDIRTFGLPEPTVAAPTTARVGQPNIWRQKFENLVKVANSMEHPPGRELESLDDLWSRMAGPKDPGLDELITLAYPKSKVKPDTVSRARQQQYNREVAGVNGPVKSMNERYDGGVKGEAAAPLQRDRILPKEPVVEVTPPQRKFAPSEPTQPVTPAGKQQRGGKLISAKQYRTKKAVPVAETEKPFIQSDTTQVPEGSQAYAGNAIPFRQAATQSTRTINRNKVVRNIKKNLGVVIDSGRLRSGRGVLGVYKVNPEVVRTRMAEDIQVISHEVGHHLDKKFKLQDARFNNEFAALIQHNPVLNVSAYQPHQLPGEGVAEYVRLRLTDPDAARRLAPNFTRYFDGKLDKQSLKGLEASQLDVDTWISQGDYNQAKGLVDFDSSKAKEPFSKDKAYTRFVDDLNPLQLAEKALKGAVGKGSDSLYKMARLSRGIGERAKLAVTRGIYDSQGNKVSEGLRQIVKPLEKMGIKEDDFATYLAVKHAQDLKAMGKAVPFSDAQMSAVLRKLDTPEVQAVQKQIIDYNNKLLDILVDAQILTSKAVGDMRKQYPNYVPFLRHFEDDVEAGFKNGGYGAGKAFANVTNPIKKMSEEGSTRTIINPMESMVLNTFKVMNAAAKNKTGLQLAELAKVNGAGTWVEHVGPGGSAGNEHIISVWQKGKKEAYKIRDAELYNAMLSLDAESTNSLIKFLGSAASILRAGATLTPEFTLRNAMRDVVGATINSTKYGFNPIDFFKGLGHVIGKTKTFDQFLSSGGAMSTMMSLDRDATREAMEQVFRQSLKDKSLNIVTSPKELAKLLSGITPTKAVIGGLRKAAEVSELSTKVGAFNKTLKKTGDLEEAAYTARDLMDFNRAGSAIRQANKAVAFLNAAIQGTDKMRRAAWGDGLKDWKTKANFLGRAFTTLVLPTIGLHYWVNNLPEDQKKVFDNIPQYQKDNFFIVPIPGTDQFARIPKPFEAGMIFSTGTERVLRWMADNDSEAYKEYGKTLLESFTPPVMISALTPLLEALTNHSFFRNAPVVPQGEQRLEKKDQFGMYTSETAKLIGKGVSMIPGLDDSNAASPRIIDNTIKGYTAGLGQYGVGGLDQLLKVILGEKEVQPPQKEWYERPPVSGFLATTSGGGQARQDFYDKWDQLSKEKASADKNRSKFENVNEYARLKNSKAIIDKLMDQYKRIQNDRAISAQDKRSKLDALDGKMNDIASKSLGK
jgi:Asp-tRNA(Asn)/Glu-tRNA(Gln) amidotransferase C subunit